MSNYHEEIVKIVQSARVGFEFEHDVINRNSVEMMIQTHRAQYIQSVIELADEKKFIKTNWKDFEESDLTQLQKAKALEDAVRGKKEPQYFKAYKPAEEIQLAVQQIGVIIDKKEVIKQKLKLVKFYGNIIRTLIGLKDKLPLDKKEEDQS
jgi:hypothetical protein